MNAAYKMVPTLDEFSAAAEHYRYIVEHLHAEETRRLEHGAVEAFLHQEGMELLRRLLQGHLDVRARREARLDSVVGCDGVERTHLREGCARGLMTLFGEVEVRRKGYSARGACWLSHWIALHRHGRRGVGHR